MSLRIRFAEPRPPGRTVFDHVLLPRLGLPLMATILAQQGHDTAVFCELLSPIDRDECRSADLVGISATTATQPAAYALANELGEAGVDVVLGGPHVSFCADEALDHAPYVVRGEGQQTIVELADALEHGRTVSEIAGLSWRDHDGSARHNPDRRRCTQAEFEALPTPDLSRIRGHEQMRLKPIMTQWGCPFDCDFCSVTAQFSRVVRYRRTDQIIEELAGLDAEEVFFYDDNFVVNKRRTRELLHAMIEAGITPSFSAQVRADFVLRSRVRGGIDHEFLDLLHRAGCEMVMIGFESVSDANLAQVGKRSTVATTEQAVAALHAHGISVHGMFVVGLDGDDATSAQATADFARRHGIDTVQLMMITPAPGTRFFDRIASEGRLIEADWTLFDGHHAVLRPRRMTPLQLQLSTPAALLSFYSRRAIARSALDGVTHHLPALAHIARRHGGAAAAALVRQLRRRGDGDGPLAPGQTRLIRTLEVLESNLTAQERAELSDALLIPALQLYARHQITKQCAQERTLQHVSHLVSLH